MECIVQSSSITEIACILGENAAGSYSILLEIQPFGYANKDKTFNYDLIVDSLSNDQGSTVGGLNLEIRGKGFSNQTTVKICEKACSIKSSQHNVIVCVVINYSKVIEKYRIIRFLFKYKVPESGQNTQSTNCPLVIQQKSLIYTSQFIYNSTITPTILNATPLRGGTGGGTLLKITGTNFP